MSSSSENKIKGTGMVTLRNHFRKKKPMLEQELLAGLSSEDEKTYRDSFAVSWLPMDSVARIYEKAAAVLYPGDAKGIQRMGIVLAKESLTGIRKIIMSVISINFLVRQAASIWSNYLDKGKVRAETVPGTKKIYLILEDYPQMPFAIRERVSGFVWGAIEYAGAKNVSIKRDDSNSRLWKWEITWE